MFALSLFILSISLLHLCATYLSSNLVTAQKQNFTHTLYKNDTRYKLRRKAI